MIGLTLDDRYRILSLLGEGGMGQVYLAEHVVLGKRMAVKVLHEHFSNNGELVRRFQQEAIAASQIGQENIVSVTDFGRTPDGALYFVMEALEGESLAAVLHREGALPVERALPVLVQVARALSAAHSRGIIHRDLKPENVILLHREGRPDFVKVLDFGISKCFTLEAGPEGPVTHVGRAVGTPEYMAPEQADAGPVDARSDVYALGVLAYEMLTGALPFTGETPAQVLLKHQQEPPVPPRQRRPDLTIPAELEAFILRALSKPRERRPESMAEVQIELAQLTQALCLAPLSAPLGSASLAVAERSVPGLAPERTSSTGSRRTLPPPVTEVRGRAQLWALCAGLGLLLFAAGGLARWLKVFNARSERLALITVTPQEGLGSANPGATAAPVEAADDEEDVEPAAPLGPSGPVPVAPEPAEGHARLGTSPKREASSRHRRAHVPAAALDAPQAPAPSDAAPPPAAQGAAADDEEPAPQPSPGAGEVAPRDGRATAQPSAEPPGEGVGSSEGEPAAAVGPPAADEPSAVRAGAADAGSSSAGVAAGIKEDPYT